MRRLDFDGGERAKSRSSSAKASFGRSESYVKTRSTFVVVRVHPEGEQANDFSVEEARPASDLGGVATTAGGSMSITIPVVRSGSATVETKRSYVADAAVQGQDNRQQAVYNVVGAPVVAAAVSGSDRCVIAYGATATGKTHTLFGSDDDVGLIPQTLRALIASPDVVAVSMSMVELQESGVFDLLNSRSRLDVRKLNNVFGLHAPNDARVTDTFVRLFDAVDVENALKGGLTKRTVRETAKNPRSTRGHVVVTARVSIARAAAPSVIRFVDLAGNEPAGLSTDTPFINASLSALSQVLGALATRGIPQFRDSPLTSLLQGCLAGPDAFTFLIATIDPRNSSQTIATMDWVATTRRMQAAVVPATNRGSSSVNLQYGAAAAALAEELAVAKREIAQLKGILSSSSRDAALISGGDATYCVSPDSPPGLGCVPRTARGANAMTTHDSGAESRAPLSPPIALDDTPPSTPINTESVAGSPAPRPTSATRLSLYLPEWHTDDVATAAAQRCVAALQTDAVTTTSVGIQTAGMTTTAVQTDAPLLRSSGSGTDVVPISLRRVSAGAQTSLPARMRDEASGPDSATSTRRELSQQTDARMVRDVATDGTPIVARSIAIDASAAVEPSQIEEGAGIRASAARLQPNHAALTVAATVAGSGRAGADAASAASSFGDRRDGCLVLVRVCLLALFLLSALTALPRLAELLDRTSTASSQLASTRASKPLSPFCGVGEIMNATAIPGGPPRAGHRCRSRRYQRSAAPGTAAQPPARPPPGRLSWLGRVWQALIQWKGL